MLPVLRYVDDYFGPSRCHVRVSKCWAGGPLFLCCIRTGTAKHALKCFARLVRVLLGTSAVADEKCEVGESLVVLGVEVQMSQKGYSFRPAADKAGGWSGVLGAVSMHDACTGC